MSKEIPCTSSGPCCCHLCSSLRKQKNPFEVWANTEVTGWPPEQGKEEADLAILVAGLVLRWWFGPRGLLLDLEGQQASRVPPGPCRRRLVPENPIGGCCGFLT